MLGSFIKGSGVTGKRCAELQRLDVSVGIFLRRVKLFSVLVETAADLLCVRRVRRRIKRCCAILTQSEVGAPKKQLLFWVNVVGSKRWRRTRHSDDRRSRTRWRIRADTVQAMLWLALKVALAGGERAQPGSKGSRAGPTAREERHCGALCFQHRLHRAGTHVLGPSSSGGCPLRGQRSWGESSERSEAQTGIFPGTEGKNRDHH